MKLDTRKNHILEEIVLHKVKEVAQMQSELSLTSLQQQLKVNPPQAVRNFLSALQQSPYRPSLIAEVKKASPSKGIIKENFDPVEIARAYERSGAACISVLTDQKFFQGSFDNLRKVRFSVEIPLLCKEFIIDPYQIYFARNNGADAVLLIAAILKDSELQAFLEIIHGLGMTALVEVHTLEELDRALKIDGISLIGINNRNLDNFTVDIHLTQQLLSQRKQQIQSNITIVSESGLYTNADLSLVALSGARSVLVGESLVKQTNIEQAVQTLLNSARV
ncbi:indole-3-glycerol phosphate synthase [Calothrix sp. NIES-4071]|nr:indole-3-glycerol phosphate synthase [Calothrix sp. NIES-4071]BAZ60014.1 indole-3-glycerol phosphate synthase [Calothrix sp. NIES-4105]